MEPKKIVLAGFATLLSVLAAPSPAQDTLAFAAISAGLTSIPVGHMEFCTRRPAECQPASTLVAEVELTPAKWETLQAVNNHYNTTITAVSDMDLYGVAEFWTYPANGYGDCEDIALAKRAALIERGWPASALLMTIVMQENGEGHAVLTVRTDRGDLILDNQEGLIKLWSDTPYVYLKRQSQAHAGQWVDILDPRDATVVATAGH